jgi:hypothetical protein
MLRYAYRRCVNGIACICFGSWDFDLYLLKGDATGDGCMDKMVNYSEDLVVAFAAVEIDADTIAKSVRFKDVS